MPNDHRCTYVAAEKEFFDGLSDEEALQFQFFMLVKTLKKFHYTEIGFLNDLVGTLQRLLRHFVEELGEEKMMGVLETVPRQVETMLLMVSYYLGLLTEQEGDNFYEESEWE